MPPKVTYPGVYIEEIPAGARPIEGVGTSVAAFVGCTPGGATDRAVRVRSWREFEQAFGGRDRVAALGHSVGHFFANGGSEAYIVRIAGADGAPLEANTPAFEDALFASAGGLGLLDAIDFNLLCVPGETRAAVLHRLQAFCADHPAFLIGDGPRDAAAAASADFPGREITGADASHCALYLPWVLAPDPLQGNKAVEYPPSGFLAGLYARNDARRGVWSAPAGSEGGLEAATDVAVRLGDAQIEALAQRGVNCLRRFEGRGVVAWGARTLASGSESDYKYVPVRRLSIYLEESLSRGLAWVVFEPNGEPLWARIRAAVEGFMEGLFRRGALLGATPREAFFVKCGRETMTQSDIDQGIVDVEVGFAPLKPAEFVVLRLQRFTGSRRDPYKNFKFRVVMAGRCIAGVSKVSALKRTTEAVAHRDAAMRRMPGLNKGGTVTMKRGIINAGSLQEWLSRAAAPCDVTIESIDEGGRAAAAFNLRACRITKLHGASLAASANEVAIETLTLQCEGLAIDDDGPHR